MSSESPFPSVIAPAFKNPPVLAPTPSVNPAVPMLKVVAVVSNLPPSEMTNVEAEAREPEASSLSVPPLIVVEPL